eukprot:scaffold57080_cov19-Tisochrysis_lutea.AAC.1
MGFQATLTWCVAGPFARAWMRNWPKYPEPPTISTFIAGMCAALIGLWLASTGAVVTSKIN